MNLDGVYNKLKSVMYEYSIGLDCKSDTGKEYHLDTKYIMKNKKPLFFGAVKINKHYVSYHLMAVYVNPSLLRSMSVNLGKRKQGKSCFNFKAIDTELLEELKSLTSESHKYYRREGYIQI